MRCLRRDRQALALALVDLQGVRRDREGPAVTVMSDAAAASLDTALAWIRHWRGTTGPAHADARREAQAALARWRTYHQRPAQAAFAATVAASQAQHRRAA